MTNLTLADVLREISEVLTGEKPLEEGLVDAFTKLKQLVAEGKVEPQTAGRLIELTMIALKRTPWLYAELAEALDSIVFRLMGPLLSPKSKEEALESLDQIIYLFKHFAEAKRRAETVLATIYLSPAAKTMVEAVQKPEELPEKLSEALHMIASAVGIGQVTPETALELLRTYYYTVLAKAKLPAELREKLTELFRPFAEYKGIEISREEFFRMLEQLKTGLEQLRAAIKKKTLVVA